MRIIFAVIALLLITTPALAHTVTMNLRISIQDTTDTIRVNGTSYTAPTSLSFTDLSRRYILSDRAGTVAGLVFAGSRFIRAAFDTTAGPYLLSMTQDEPDNRFVIPLTAAAWQDVDATYSLSPDRIPATTFGNTTAVAASFPAALVLQLTFDNLDLLGPLGPGQVMITNLGRVRIPQIQLEMIG